MYFHALFYLHVFSKSTNNVTRTTLPNGKAPGIQFMLPMHKVRESYKFQMHVKQTMPIAFRLD